MAARKPHGRNIKGRNNPPRKEITNADIKMGIASPGPTYVARMMVPNKRMIVSGIAGAGAIANAYRHNVTPDVKRVLKKVNPQNPRGGVGARKKK